MTSNTTVDVTLCNKQLRSHSELGKIPNQLQDLHSCLLINHHWFEVSVQILWRTIQNHSTLITKTLSVGEIHSFTKP